MGIGKSGENEGFFEKRRKVRGTREWREEGEGERERME